MPRWTFEDPVGSDSYSFHINPNEGGTPSYEKTLTYSETAGPGGKTIMFEGHDKPQEIEFSGILLTEDQLLAFIEWFEKRRQIILTDDLGRSYTIYITSFQPKRNRRVIHPYHHNYSMRATILDF